MSKEKRIWLLVDLFIVAIFTTLDQLTKHLAVIYLKDQPEIPIWEGVLELRYLENTGAAFGMLAGQKIFILFIVLVFLAIAALLIRCSLNVNTLLADANTLLALATMHLSRLLLTFLLAFLL